MLLHKNFASFLLLLSCIITFFSACNNDLELVGNRTEIPVAYGAISSTDTFVYIRLERAFGDNNIAPGQIAKNLDSLYYTDAQVTISLPEENFSIQLDKTDATALGFPRDTGIFVNTPNYIYKADKSLFVFKPGGAYILTINAKGKTYTAKTLLINEVTLQIPSQGSSLGWIPRIKEVQSQNPRFDYEPLPGTNRNADPAILDMSVRFNYSERNITVSNDYVSKSLIIPVIQSFIPDDDTDFRYSANKIFEHIGKTLERSPDIDRYFTSADFILTCGGKEFLSYSEALAANAGITGTQDFPSYTNIEGGQGIFSSKNTQEFKGFYLTKATLDSLAISRYTTGLNFRTQ